MEMCRSNSVLVLAFDVNSRYVHGWREDHNNRLECKMLKSIVDE